LDSLPKIELKGVSLIATLLFLMTTYSDFQTSLTPNFQLNSDYFWRNNKMLRKGLICFSLVIGIILFFQDRANGQVLGVIKKAGKATASGVKKGSKATASGLKKGSKATASGVKKGSKATASGVKKGSLATAKGGKWVVVKTWNGSKWVYRKIFIRNNKRRL
jgi:hypothetical protein